MGKGFEHFWKKIVFARKIIRMFFFKISSFIRKIVKRKVFVKV